MAKERLARHRLLNRVHFLRLALEEQLPSSLTRCDGNAHAFQAQQYMIPKSKTMPSTPRVLR